MKSVIFSLLTFMCLTTLAQQKPNVVIIFMDNFGWGEPGFNGGGITRGAETPRMDNLAKQGLKLTNFNERLIKTELKGLIETERFN